MVDPVANLLTVDCGNSTVDCFCHATGRRLRIAVADGGHGMAPLAAFVRETRPGRCAALAVVPGALGRLAELLLELHVSLRIAGRELPCPLPLAYHAPETLGADRWVGALAAHRRFGRAVTVDCGSATTINLVDQDGTFRGGAIAPGLRAFVLGLAAVTPRMPAPRLDAEPVMLATSSQDAVDAGALLGYAGLVERLVADTLRAAPGPARVVVTGGNAERLLRHSRLLADHVPDLVHQGLRHLDETAG